MIFGRRTKQTHGDNGNDNSRVAATKTATSTNLSGSSRSRNSLCFGGTFFQTCIVGISVLFLILFKTTIVSTISKQHYNDYNQQKNESQELLQLPTNFSSPLRNTNNHLYQQEEEEQQQLLENGNYYNPANSSSDASLRCLVTDVSKFTLTNDRKHTPIGIVRDRSWPQCLKFRCNDNTAECDTYDATVYNNKDSPPCCTHILRDILVEMDKITCYLGIEVLPAFGTVLGLTRGDRVIPWTSDNDYIATSENLAALYNGWETTERVLQHGLALFWVTFDRICVTKDFAGGALAKYWEIPNAASIDTSKYFYDDLLPYADIFISNVSRKQLRIFSCRHATESIWPTIRQPVYNNSFYLTYPNDPSAILSTIYGKSWMYPPSRKSRHGNTMCNT